MCGGSDHRLWSVSYTHLDVYKRQGVLLTACGNSSQKGVEYLEDGKYDQAIEQFEQAVDKKKNVGDAYRGIGIAKWEKKDYKGARKAFKKALENDAEKTGTIYNMIGNCDLKLGEAKEALNYYNLGPVSYTHLDVYKRQQ